MVKRQEEGWKKNKEIDKLERKPRPDIYCPLCLGYGMITSTLFNGKCSRCYGTGWIYEGDLKK